VWPSLLMIAATNMEMFPVIIMSSTYTRQ
jgi:hypothetical protein